MTYDGFRKWHVCNALSMALVAILLSFAIEQPAYATSEAKLLMQEDHTLQILIVADPQDTATPQKATINLLEAALDSSDPDLVVFLGDMIHGDSIRGMEDTRAAIDAIVAPVVQRDIPFALVFGNHDSQSGISNEEQLRIYQEYPGCLAVEGEELPGCGNYYILFENPVNPDQPIVLWFLDSGTYAEAERGEYGYVTSEQNAWMLRMDKKLRGFYADPAYFIFQHIPVPQTYELLNAVPFGTKGSVTPLGPGFGTWYIADPDKVWAGHFGEGPCASEYDSGEFDTWKTMNVQAAFFGHDHLNDYCGTVDDIDLIATSGIGFYLYGRGEEHGARLVAIDAEQPFDYTTEMLYYRDLNLAPMPPLMIPVLGVLIQRYVIIGMIILVVVIAFIWILLNRRKGRKHASD